MDLSLIVRLLARLAAEPDGGAILVFLPGVPEIRRLHRELEAAAGGGRGGGSGARGGSSATCGSREAFARMHILHLHGGLSGEEQSAVFRRAPPGKRKVVLSTNVAETSITIDDVTVVVDSLRVKESEFDAENGTARLTETWVSQAAARQRRGRAGRVRAGVCFRLAPLALFEALAPHGTPEVQRAPLESMCLQVGAAANGGGWG